MECNSDADLMRRVARGDQAAMSELVGRWERPVLGFVYRLLTCSEDDARDIAQEVFLRVWRQRRKWKPIAGFSTWLFTIVSNLCRNRRRDLSRRPTLVPVDTEDSGKVSYPLFAAARDNPHSRAEASETAALIRDAIAQLPDAQRVAVLLRHFGELKYREIATVMGTTPSAVDSLLIRARRALSGRLGDSAQERKGNGV